MALAEEAEVATAAAEEEEAEEEVSIFTTAAAEEAAADRSCHLPPASWLLSQPKCDPCAPCVFVFLYLYSCVRAFV